MPYAIAMTGSLGSPGDPVGFYRTLDEALQALEGHQAGSYIVHVDHMGKLPVPVLPEPGDDGSGSP
jgi:hypothetical protein